MTLSQLSVQTTVVGQIRKVVKHMLIAIVNNKRYVWQDIVVL